MKYSKKYFKLLKKRAPYGVKVEMEYLDAEGQPCADLSPMDGRYSIERNRHHISSVKGYTMIFHMEYTQKLWLVYHG